MHRRTGWYLKGGTCGVCRFWRRLGRTRHALTALGGKYFLQEGHGHPHQDDNSSTGQRFSCSDDESAAGYSFLLPVQKQDASSRRELSPMREHDARDSSRRGEGCARAPFDVCVIAEQNPKFYQSGGHDAMHINDVVAKDDFNRR